MKKIFASFFTIALITPIFSSAEILFEGYYKVTQAKKHIGFVVQRNEIDSKTKNFKTTSFLKLSKNGFDMTESLTGVSDADLKPVSYSYLATDGAKTKTIDATFNFKGKGTDKEPKMSALITENGEKKKKDKKITKDTFLSSALYYFMLKSKSGIKVDTKYDFSAVAEELFDIAKGSSRIEKKFVTQGPLQLMRSQNKFAGIIDIFVDEAMVQFREKQMGKGGLLPGGDLSSTFSFLRKGSSFACHCSQITSISALRAIDPSVMCGTRS